MSKKNSKRNKKSKWKNGLKAGCLALGMATAWGAEARGEMSGLAYAEIVAAPTQTLTDAYVFYNNNVTQGWMWSLGEFPANDITTLYQCVGNLNAFAEINGERPSYVVVGLSQVGGVESVVLSFPNADALQMQWDDLFGPNGGSYYTYEESYVINALHNPGSGALEQFLNDISYDPCRTQYNHEATLVGFTNGAPASSGTVLVNIVPEPASWILLIGAAGSLLFWRRDLLPWKK
jgi:hypothetical protein